MVDDRKDEERGTPSWQLPQERQPDTDAYHIWTPRPLLRSIYWKPDPAPPFEAVSSTYEIFVDQRAWLTMHEHVWQTPSQKTPFGYLIGDLCEDPQANRRFVTITAALPARFDFREDAKEQISREATLALQLEVERRRGVLAGWYHRHVGGDVQMTASDVATHHQHFSEPWHCAFVFVGAGDRSEGGCFRAMPDRFEGDLLLPFYEMASNESLLARGVKRSYLDWSNYQTVDEIRSEPPPRPTLAVSPPAEQAKPGADPELVVQPFGAEPGGSEPEPRPSEPPVGPRPSEPEEAEPPTEEAREPPAPPPAPPPSAEAETVETAEPGIGEEPRGAAPPPAGTGSEAETEAEEVDLEAAIESMRPARIELDHEAEPAGQEEPEPASTTEPAGAPVAGDQGRPNGERPSPPAKKRKQKREETVGPAEGKPADRDEPASRKTAPLRGSAGARKKLAAVAGGVVIVAALAAGVFFLRGGRDADGPGAAGTDDVAGETVPGEDGQAGATGGAGAAGTLTVSPAEVDSAGREMMSMISRFYGRAVARDRGEATCQELAAAYVSLENAWIRYSTDYKARFEGPLPDSLAERDERLYAGVQDAEREFDQSGCPRP